MGSALKSVLLTLPEASPVNVLIAYDEVPAGRRGMELFRALRRDAVDEQELHCDLWRFDLIGLPGIHQAAVLAATHARIIIVATNANVDLPTSVKDWLDQSLAGKSPGSAAVIALLHSHRAGAGVTSSPSRASLELLAYRRKLHFFGSSAGDIEQEAAPGAKRRREGTSETSPALQEVEVERVLHRHPRPPRWGINE